MPCLKLQDRPETLSLALLPYVLSLTLFWCHLCAASESKVVPLSQLRRSAVPFCLMLCCYPIHCVPPVTKVTMILNWVQDLPHSHDHHSSMATW